MAKFVLTIESDNPEEIASFLSPGRQPIMLPEMTLTEEDRSMIEEAVQASYQASYQADDKAREETQAKRRGRPAKADPRSSTSSELLNTDTSSDPINTPSTSPSSLAEPDPAALLDEVKALIHKAVSVKSAKETVSLLTEKCGTPAPQAMNPTQLAAAKTALEGLLNG